MKSLTRVLLGALVALTSLLGIQTNAMADYGKQQVVYHVNHDNAKRQGGVLRNIQNHINAVGAENMNIQVVMHGNGLSLLVLPEEAANVKNLKGNADEKMQTRISSLKAQGVEFKICANTLKGRKVTLDEHLFDASQSDVVPSGVAEIAKLQGQGYSYLRP